MKFETERGEEAEAEKIIKIKTRTRKTVIAGETILCPQIVLYSRYKSHPPAQKDGNKADIRIVCGYL